MQVGFIGLGAMGRPIAANIAKAGWPLAVFNRTAAKAAGLEGKTLRVVRSPAEAAAGADVVVTMLADDAAVEAVAFGSGGILETLRKDAIHVSMSTISVAFSRRLAAAHGAAGQGYVAAPVFGRPEAAAAAKLWVVAGGAKGLVERCRPLFERMSQGVFHVGEIPESANAVKLAGNFLIVAMLEALGEALALARKSGVEPGRFLEIANTALFKSPLYENYGRLAVEQRFEPAGFRLRLGLKDVGLALAAAAQAEVPMPTAGLIHGQLLSAVARGMGDLDWSALTRVIAENAGLRGP